MVPQPLEHAAEPGAPSTADVHRALPTPFLTKTYQLVDEPAIDDVISWNEDGSTFIVWRPAEFARDLLPKYFKHNNFSSFVRQLNTYGFRKIVPDRWEFANDYFRKGEKRLLCDIHRRKVQPAPAAVLPAVPTAIPVAIPGNRVASPTNSGGDDQVLSSNSSHGATPPPPGGGNGGTSTDLAEENHRLRGENERLNQELSQLKDLCDNILLLMTNYKSQQQQQQHPQEDQYPGVTLCTGTRSTNSPPPSPPLELRLLTRTRNDSEAAGPSRAHGVQSWSSSSSDENEEEEEEEGGPRPRLFGVAIGMKRPRGAEEADAPPVGDEQRPQHRRAADFQTRRDPPCMDDYHCRRMHARCRPANQTGCDGSSSEGAL